MRKGSSFVPVVTTGGQERCLSVGKTKRMFDNDHSQAIIRTQYLGQLLEIQGCAEFFWDVCSPKAKKFSYWPDFFFTDQRAGLI